MRRCGHYSYAAAAEIVKVIGEGEVEGGVQGRVEGYMRGR